MIRRVATFNKSLTRSAFPTRALSTGILRSGLGRNALPSLLTITKGKVGNYRLCRTRKYSVLTTDGKEIDAEIDNIDIDKYHDISTNYMESLFDELEELSENHIQLEVDYSDGVLNMELPPSGNYCINKQPPNKQIWLSSPVSGPNRYDLVKGEWVSLRDGSKLTNIIEEEVSNAIGQPFKLKLC